MVYGMNANIKYGGDKNIERHGAHGIGNGVIALPHEIAEAHGSGISGNASPCTGYVAIARHENYVYGNEHCATCTRKPSTPNGLVDELIPK